ncbi:MAG: cadmium-translocating P-type ATPase [Acetilactobacillus jinshanensis]
MNMSGHNMKGMNMDHHSMKGMDMSNMKGMQQMDMGDGMTMKGSHMLMKMPGGVMMDMTGLKQKFWLALVLMIPIIFMSPFMGTRLPFQITFPGSDWVVAVIGSVLFFYCGQPFFTGAKGEMKLHKPAMMSLISMGITVAYVYSIYAVIANDLFNVTPKVMNFFVELATLIVIMLLGHWIEMDTVMDAGSAVDKLAELLPDTAHLVQANGKVKDVKIDDLTPGDQVVIKAGEKVPADGKIVKGSSRVNESLVTGESKPVKKHVKDQVIGGSTNEDGTIQIKVTGTGKSGFLSQVMDLVSSAQNHKSKKENLADRVSGYLFYAALTAAIIAFVGWSLVHSVTYAIMMAVSALVIACPHALGLAVPLVVSRTTSLAATHGLLIRNRNALEDINHIKYALMDKTGTLTQGKFKVNALKSLDHHYSNAKILEILASLEQDSSHPLATGILNQAKAQHVSVAKANNVNQITGLGLKGTVNNQEYAIVARKYLLNHHINFDADQFKALASRGNSVSYLITNQRAVGIVAEGDQIKPGSQKLIQFLKAHQIEPVMLTGDNPIVAKKVAQDLGDISYKAGLLPNDKQKIVNQYQNQAGVMFIGDGVNDAPSLAKANLGIAIGSGTDVAIDSADVVLVNSDPKDVISLINLAHHSNAKMVENLWWGAGYNIVAIPLAAGLLAFAGIIITPTVGAIIMSLSTVVVAINAMTLRIK